MDYFETLLHRAACAATLAATACHNWEEGGDSDPVADTASEVDGATLEAVEAVAGIDPTLTLDTYPETRVARLTLAARLLVLAGIDEDGGGQDLEFAAKLFELAAAA